MRGEDIVDRPFESFDVGETAFLERQVANEEIALFATLSGDHNDLHMSESYAANGPYKQRIAHGLLVAAPISALAGHFLPGRRCLLLEVRSRFIQPVFPGDRLTYRGIITHVSPATSTLRVQVEVSNQEGAVVLKGGYDARVLGSSSDREGV